MLQEDLRTSVPKLSKQHPEKVCCQNLVVACFKIMRFLKHVFLTQCYVNNLRAAEYKSSSTASDTYLVTLFAI